MQLALCHPEIPPNTGSVVRLCAATATPLHLVAPLGFQITDSRLKRAGLDYWAYAQVMLWADWDAFRAGARPPRLVAASARDGEAHHRFAFRPDDVIVIGPETRGLPQDILAACGARVRIPIWGRVRSLNMANAASVLLYEALRQTGGLGGESAGAAATACGAR